MPHQKPIELNGRCTGTALRGEETKFDVAALKGAAYIAHSGLLYRGLSNTLHTQVCEDKIQLHYYIMRKIYATEAFHK